jgi:amidohydrolase
MRNSAAVRHVVHTGLAAMVLVTPTYAQTIDDRLQSELPSLKSMYERLHASPEISHFEEQTAAFVAAELRQLGFEVTERVGNYRQAGLTSYGIVAVMQNGNGPAVMIRTDLDGLPVEEKTGLPYASTKTVRNEAGEEVRVMHACGHDLHMTAFVGAARLLSRMKDRWQGTLIMIGQPAEERGTGARAMLDDGLYTRFPRPDYVVALHTDASLEAGKVGYVEGFALANVHSVDITVRGAGGHGAYPHTTKDPVVIAAQIVLALQTIASRETSPFDPVVVTVGSIHGGTKHNIIPDEVHLQLTVRSYREDVRKNVLASIDRIAKNVARAAGMAEDRLPLVAVNENEYTPATYNDPELTQRLTAALQSSLAEQNVVPRDPVMGGEDFGRFALGGEIPISLFWLGAVDPAKVKKSREEGRPLPSLHSSEFAPLPEPAIRTGVKALTMMALELMKK